MSDFMKNLWSSIKEGLYMGVVITTAFLVLAGVSNAVVLAFGLA